MNATHDAYRPGVCNIDARGRRLRYRFSAVAIVSTLALWAVFVASATPPPWRLLLFVPAAAGVTAWLEASRSFCVVLGTLDLVDLGGLRRLRRSARDPARRADRRAALRLSAVSIVAGALVAATAYLTAR